MFMLVDCNSFFASCERLFRPDLIVRAIAVLSPNDGFVVSRTDEARALGVEVGQPSAHLRSLIASGQLIVFSANYTLYADMSRRVMETLAQFTSSLNVYSIDEAFLDVSHATDVMMLGRSIRHAVHQWTGIPVSIGIAPTRTLAKLGSHLARQWPDPATAEGVLDLRSPTTRRAILESIAINEIWGIGDRFRHRLRGSGILTAYQLTQAKDEWLRKCLGVNGLRIVMELRGIPSLPHSPTIRQTYSYSRSFGRPVTSTRELREAASSYTVRAGERLRRDGAVASALSLFVAASRWQTEAVRYVNACTVVPAHPTNQDRELIQLASRAIERLIRPGIQYARVGVVLSGVQPISDVNGSLFDSADPRSTLLMDAIDALNLRYGKRTVYFAAEGLSQSWQSRRENVSSPYTTDIHHLVTVRV